MALIKCPECGREISEYADSCIGCGCPAGKIKEILQQEPCSENTDSDITDIKSTVLDPAYEGEYATLLVAAISNDTRAQCELGYWFYAGEKVEQNLARSFVMFKLAAERGDAEGQYVLGTFYEYGYGCEADLEAAIELYQDAALQDYADAQFRLGEYYRVECPDETLAIHWHTQVANKGYANAQLSLAVIFAGRENHAKANYWYRKAAEQGNVQAQILLGINYGLGKGIECDTKEAAFWLEKASEQGRSDAQYMAAIAYEALGDIEKAYYWCQKAVDQGEPRAAEKLNDLSSLRKECLPQSELNSLFPFENEDDVTNEELDDNYMYEVREQIREREEYYRDWTEYTQDD